MPLGVGGYLLFSEINEKIEFAAQELKGNAYLRELWAVRMQVAVHSAPRGETHGRPAPGTWPAVNLKELTQLDRALGPRLKTAQQLAEVRAASQAWKSGGAQRSSAENAALFARVVKALDALNTQVGNNSNLILDPDLDSYYVMDAILLKLPEAQNLLLHTRSSITRALSQSATRREKISEELNPRVALLQGNLAALRAGLEQAFENNPGGGLKAALTSPLNEYRQATERFLTVTHTLVAASLQTTLDAAYYNKLAEDALRSSSALWTKGSHRLDKLLAQRIAKFEARKRVATVVSLSSMLMVLYFGSVSIWPLPAPLAS